MTELLEPCVLYSVDVLNGVLGPLIHDVHTESLDSIVDGLLIENADSVAQQALTELLIQPLSDVATTGTGVSQNGPVPTITVDTTVDKFAIDNKTTFDELLKLQSEGFEVSLREAVFAAQQGPARLDQIVLPGGIYELTRSISLSSLSSEGEFGDLDLSDDTILVGASADNTSIVQTRTGNRVMQIDSANVTIQDLTITGGASITDGGGVASFGQGTLTISHSVIDGNRALGQGGGIYVAADLMIIDSVISNNTSANTDGGGVYATGRVDVEKSSFESNRAERNGGAIYAENDRVTIADTGFTDNAAKKHGGAVAALNDLQIERSSFLSNAADSDNDGEGRGGAIAQLSDVSLKVDNVTFALNAAEDGGAVFTSAGGSISNASFVENSATGKGAGVYGVTEEVLIDSSLFLDNSSSGTQGADILWGKALSSGFNLFDYRQSNAQATDANNKQFELEARTTLNHVSAYPLPADSMAINAGSSRNADGSDAQGFARDEVPDIGSSEYDSDTSVVFWTDSNGDLYRSQPHFGNTQKIAQTEKDAASITVDSGSGRLFWLQSNNTEVFSTRLDGKGGNQEILTGLSEATSLVVDSGSNHLYVSFAGSNPRIDRYELNTGELIDTVVASHISHPTDITVNPLTRLVFWAEAGDDGATRYIRSSQIPDQGLDMQFPPQSVAEYDVLLGDQIVVANGGEPLDRQLASVALLGDLDLGIGTMTINQNASIRIVVDIPVNVMWNYEDNNELLVLTEDYLDSLLSLDAETLSVQQVSKPPETVTSFASMSTSTISAKPELQNISALQVKEGGTSRITIAELKSVDSDSAAESWQYKVTRLPENGWFKAGTTIDPENFTQADIDAGRVSYLHNGSETIDDQIELRLMDERHQTNRFLFDINVSPTNDPPAFDIEVTQLLENEAEASVATLTSRDPDAGDSLTYSVDDNRFHAVGNTIKLKSGEIIDFETEAQITLQIRASDVAGLVVSEALVLQVLDQNDAPVFNANLDSVKGDGFQLPLDAVVDADGDPLKFEAFLATGDALPGWLIFDADSVSFSVREGYPVENELAVFILGDDGRGGLVSIPLTLYFDPLLAAAEPLELSVAKTDSIGASQSTVKAQEQRLVESQSKPAEVDAGPEPDSVQAIAAAHETDPPNGTTLNAVIPELDGTVQALVNKAFVDVDVKRFHETIDLQDLISPVSAFGGLELAKVENTTEDWASQAWVNASMADVDVFDLSSLLKMPQSDYLVESRKLDAAIDKLKETEQSQVSFTTPVMGTSAGVSTGISVGYLMWLLRNGTLMGSVLSALPAWRFVDPLPVLASLDDDVDDDQESLASMVDKDHPDNDTGKEAVDDPEKAQAAL